MAAEDAGYWSTDGAYEWSVVDSRDVPPRATGDQTATCLVTPKDPRNSTGRGDGLRDRFAHNWSAGQEPIVPRTAPSGRRGDN